MAMKMQDPETYNRIFILGAKNCTEDTLRDLFSKFGIVKDVYFVKDRHTDERKDISYVTFSKASEAALAIEEMNGKCFGDNPRPLKVILANSRNEGSVRDPHEETKMLRLFIVVPKHYSEGDVRNDFSKYGEIDYVRFLTDRNTGQSRGLAYVKYFRAYHAALALEGCSAHYKPVFATIPKAHDDSRSGRQSASDQYKSYGQPSYDRPYEAPGISLLPGPRRDSVESARGYENPPTLEALLPTLVTAEQANRLFDLMPGLTYCSYDQQSGIAYIQYSSTQAAAYAKQKLDGFEYPPGYRVAVRFYRGGQGDHVAGFESYLAADAISKSVHAVNQTIVATTENPNATANVKVLVETIQKAMSLLQQSGMGDAAVSAVAGGQTSGLFNPVSSSGAGGPVKYCSASLPDRQPIAPHDSEIVERLFIVSTPEAFPQSFLEDCFCRFGNMIGAYFMPGRKYGYVKYASGESARQAVDLLHGQMICGNRIKVMIAEKPRYPMDSHSSDKRKYPGDYGVDDDMDQSNKRAA